MFTEEMRKFSTLVSGKHMSRTPYDYIQMTGLPEHLTSPLGLLSLEGKSIRKDSMARCSTKVIFY